MEYLEIIKSRPFRIFVEELDERLRLLLRRYGLRDAEVRDEPTSDGAKSWMWVAVTRGASPVKFILSVERNDPDILVSITLDRPIDIGASRVVHPLSYRSTILGNVGNCDADEVARLARRLLLEALKEGALVR